METNVWGSNYRYCVSERAFGDYQTRDEQRKLLQAYKKAGMKRFHYTNSATLKYTKIEWFVSYYTFTIGYMIDDRTNESYICVNPFVFMKDCYRNSQTTNKQCNRWLEENGFEFTVQDIAYVYDNAIHGIDSNIILQRYVKGTPAELVNLYFNHTQTYLNEDGTQSYQRATNKVPIVRYNEYQNSLVCVGYDVITKRDVNHE